ncbi:hypothetical protein JX265_005889 [Neoarthrinium moseri]|uniref:Uncharacterized protein n=1 Tax=Neoarthrinium moseri TaxID=1658444 RepID=A0A9P9WNY0_9PEZI|nr:hypothetical protein JX265_005889 [Neoarthrinium moseri]
MGDQGPPWDITLSNGTCYWKSGKIAGKEFIPCGNAALPNVNWQCCNVGDICLSSGACFNSAYGATYLVGCTDPSYADEKACPSKGDFDDQQWVGLVTCDIEQEGAGKDTPWAGCSEPHIDHLTSFAKGCKCDSTNTPLFTDYPTLINSASLPKSSGGRLSFFDERTPTIPWKPTATSGSVPSGTLVSAGATTQSLPAATGEASDSSSSEAGLSTGAKAGIGAGVAGGALLFGLVAFLVLFLRRRSKSEHTSDQTNAQPSSQPDSTISSGPSTGCPYATNAASPSLSGFKAELAADGPPSALNTISPISPASPHFQQQQRQYEAYNPDRHGNYSHYAGRSNVHSGLFAPVSPQHTGTSSDHNISMNDRSGQQPMSSIAELQG